jgi:hypothetical protein
MMSAECMKWMPERSWYSMNCIISSVRGVCWLWTSLFKVYYIYSMQR